MKRHSILSTLFPRLPFSRCSLSELMAEYQIVSGQRQNIPLTPGLGSFIESGSGDKFIWVSNGLPSFDLKIASSVATAKEVEVACHIAYQEPDKATLDLTRNKGVALIRFEAIKREENSLKHVVDFQPSEGIPAAGSHGDDSDVNIQLDLFRALVDPDVDLINIIIHIDVLSLDDLKASLVEKIERPTDEQLKVAYKRARARRRQLVAAELTTGYRRYIGLCLYLIHLASNKNYHHGQTNRKPSYIMEQSEPQIVHPDSARATLHATPEDAGRLLCSFSSVEKASKRENRAAIGTDRMNVLNVNSFIQQLILSLPAHNPDPEGATEYTTAELIVNRLYNHKCVGLDIGFRKTFEYYLYEKMSCMP